MTHASKTHASNDLRERARFALDHARECLLDRREPGGYWRGELETNVTMDAEDLLMREFLGIRTREETARSANWIRSQQREDGSFATFYGGPPDLSTSIEAYAALRLAEDPADAPHMRAAREVIVGLGGIAHSRVFTRIWLALFGAWPWEALPALPPEIMFLPAWCPLNIYDFGCWARQTIVPLTIVAAHRPVRPLPFALTELHAGERKRSTQPLSTWAGRLERLDRALHLYERRPIRSLRRRAMDLGAEWIIRRQEADGGWGGIQPPWVYSVLALHLLGYPMDHPVIAKALTGLDGFLVDEGDQRRLEACQSPVWDTALAMLALRDAGVKPNDPVLAEASHWLLGEEVRVRGDWAVRRPDLEPGGWAFEFENDNYPDTDDTAEVVLALGAARDADPDRIEAAIARGVAWTVGMQSLDGGFAAFDADNTRQICAELPFCDFGEVIDPPSADVTAHVIEMLAEEGLAANASTQRAVTWLLQAQEPGGSWFGRWGANHLYGTGAAVPALRKAGLPASHPALLRAKRWLESVQNEDGGWGEDLRSYEPGGEPGLGVSTASQTAWALLALLELDPDSHAVARGIEWLVETQNAAGEWDEPYFTGTGFPGDFYIRYHLYRLTFPMMALGRFTGIAHD
jgi:squalene-hopene/tetraprenyl-beta-curcumene cyclase